MILVAEDLHCLVRSLPSILGGVAEAQECRGMLNHCKLELGWHQTFATIRLWQNSEKKRDQNQQLQLRGPVQCCWAQLIGPIWSILLHQATGDSLIRQATALSGEEQLKKPALAEAPENFRSEISHVQKARLWRPTG